MYELVRQLEEAKTALLLLILLQISKYLSKYLIQTNFCYQLESEYLIFWQLLSAPPCTVQKWSLNILATSPSHPALLNSCQTYFAAHQQGAIQNFWLHFWGALLLFYTRSLSGICPCPSWLCQRFAVSQGPAEEDDLTDKRPWHFFFFWNSLPLHINHCISCLVGCFQPRCKSRLLSWLLDVSWAGDVTCGLHMVCYKTDWNICV